MYFRKLHSIIHTSSPLIALTLILICVPFSNVTIAQITNPSCVNLDFESCDFTGWKLFTADQTRDENDIFAYVDERATVEWTSIQAADNFTYSSNTQHNIVNGGELLVFDNQFLPLVYPNEGSCSAVLGDFFQGGAKVSILRKKFVVTPEAAFIKLRYAVVLENVVNTPEEQSFFSFNIFTATGEKIECATYSALAGDNQPGWISNQTGEVFLKPWEELYIPLQDYIGESLLIEIVMADGAGGAYSGFALVDLRCNPGLLDISPINGCEFPYQLSGPSGVAAYLWSNGQTTQDIEVNVPGTYSVQITSQNGPECGASLETEIEEDEAIPLAISGGGAICVGESTQLLAQGASTYQWSPLGGLSNPTIPDPVASPLVTTTYTVEGTDENGCTTSGEVTVVVNPLPVIGTNEDQNMCVGDSVTLNAFGGTTYSWTPSNGLNDPTIANPVASPTITTTYTVTGTSQEGCQSAEQVTINVGAPIFLLVSPDVNNCPRDEVELIAEGADSYRWSPTESLSDPTIENPIAFPTETTTYTVIGRSNDGCSETREVTVNVLPLPEVNAGPDITICAGSQAQINATGAQEFAWFPAEGLSNPNSATPFVQTETQTTYTLIGTDEFGCENIDEVTVFINDVFDIQAGADTTICSGESVELRPTGGSNYIWQPSAGLDNPALANPIATPNATTTYTVSATDSLGCVGNSEITITVLPAINVEAGEDIAICEGETATLNASGASTYLWSPDRGLSDINSPTPTISASESITYTVLGTDANGCQDVDTIEYFFLTLPTVFAGRDQTICEGATTSLEATGALNYEWSPAEPLSDPTFAEPFASPEETTTFILTGVDENGCENTDSVTINIAEELRPDAGEDEEICLGEQVLLNAVGGVEFSWTPTESLSNPTIADPVARPTQTTTYIVSVTDEIGCTGIARVNVAVFPAPNITAGPDQTVCPGSEARLNGSGAINYTWSPAIDLSDPNAQDPLVTPLTSRRYILNAINENGCTEKDTIEIFVFEDFELDAGEDVFICQGDTVNLSVTGGSNYTWFPSSSLSDPNIPNPLANPNLSTTYQVSANDPNGCEGFDSVRVNVFPPVFLDISPDTTICEGESITLGVTGASFYEWLPNDSVPEPFIQNPTLFPATTQSFRVIGTDENGCSASEKMFVTVLPQPNVYAGKDTFSCVGEILQLNASGADTYQWNTDQLFEDSTNIANPFILAEFDEDIVVTGFRDGCSNTDSLSFTIIPGPVAVVDDAEVCIGDTAVLTATGGERYIWSQGDTTESISIVVTTDTIIGVTPFSAEGCRGTDDSAFVAAIPYPEASFISSDTLGVIPMNVLFTNTTVGGDTYQWSFGDETASEIEEPSHIFEEQGDFKVLLTAFNYLGCPDTFSANIFVDKFGMYVPTAFSPNGDGRNDFFTISSFNFQGATVRIFSREGRLIYQSIDKDFRWDGTFEGVSVPEGNYVCKIVGTDISGGEMTITKMVTLIR